jgi:diaminopimelate epimerase
MRVEFSKMQGLGNDFLVFDAPADRRQVPSSDTLRALADRHTGIGFDQALMLEPPGDPDSRVFYRIFNADGGEVEQCGNGARCVAALLYLRRPELGAEFTMDSPGGRVRARVQGDGTVSVEMGVPDFEPASLPMDWPAPQTTYALPLDGETVEFGAVSMGNPHVVIEVPDVANAPVDRIGARLERDPHFPRRTNVGFMQIVDRAHIKLRVFERGVGETRACGTGACAAVAVGGALGRLGTDVQVTLPGGTAGVGWIGPGRPAWLTGPATLVFTGSVEF